MIITKLIGMSNQVNRFAGYVLAVLALTSIAVGFLLVSVNKEPASSANSKKSGQVLVVDTSAKSLDVPVSWSRDLDSALRRAKRSQSGVLVDFHADWCPPCKMMEDTTFKSREVQAGLRGHELVRIDVDQQPQLATKYKVTGMPTVLYLDSNGKEIYRSTGYVGPEVMTRLLKKLWPGRGSGLNALTASVQDTDKPAGKDTRCARADGRGKVDSPYKVDRYIRF